MYNTPIEWYDSFTDTKERKIYTFQEHGIPGLRMFGCHSTSHALSALDDHFHKNCFEISFLAQGSIQFVLGEDRYELSGGDLFLVQPNVVHSTGNLPLSLHQMYWFQLEADDPDHFLFLEPETARSLLARLGSLPNTVIKLSRSAASLFPAILTSISQGTALGAMEAAQMLALLLCQILRAYDAPAVRTTVDIIRARDYILSHIREPLKLEQLAQISLLSVSRFKEKFKTQIGMSPRSFINYHKIESARELLRQGYTVTETAMELNFSSSNYFSEVFRRYTALSPTEYLARLHHSQVPGLKKE